MEHYNAVSEHQTSSSTPSMRMPEGKSRPQVSVFSSTKHLWQFPDLAIGDVKAAHEREEMSDCKSGRSRWIPGKLYPLIPGRLSFTAHDNDDQTVDEIRRYPKLFYFSNDSQEKYLPFCADFGPVNIAVLVHFCHEMREKEADKRIAHRHL
eukprot:3911608-Rhodomonas_salina.1